MDKTIEQILKLLVKINVDEVFLNYEDGLNGDSPHTSIVDESIEKYDRDGVITKEYLNRKREERDENA